MSDIDIGDMVTFKSKQTWRDYLNWHSRLKYGLDADLTDPQGLWRMVSAADTYVVTSIDNDNATISRLDGSLFGGDYVVPVRFLIKVVDDDNETST